MGDDQRAAKRRRFTSNIVTLKVGKAAECITVHETHLQDNSPFFKAALEKRWKEGQTRDVELPTDEVDVVAAYIEFLYSKSVAVDKLDNGATDHALLVRLYCFGEKILDDSSCDAVISAMVSGIDQKANDGSYILPNIEQVRTIYDGTVSGCPLRRFVVEIHAQRMSSKWSMEGWAKAPNEFMVDLITEMCKIKSAPGPHGPVFPRLATWLKAKK